MQREPAEEVVKSSEQVDEVTVRTADIQERFKFFETYKEPEKSRKEFRITPPREGQVKVGTYSIRTLSILIQTNQMRLSKV